jgi:GNAT superfamily N-acetyltransferase
MTSLVALRPAVADDASFVLSSWLKSFFRHRSAWQSMVRLTERQYFKGHHELLRWIITRSETVVACPADDPGLICGWCCYQPLTPVCVVHYVYVKDKYRGFGIGRQLFEAATAGSTSVAVSHWTRRLSEDKADVKYGVEVNPYSLWLSDGVTQ